LSMLCAAAAETNVPAASAARMWRSSRVA